MTNQDIQLGVDILTLAVAAIGVPFVLVSLHHARTANFIAAWLAISDRLQTPDIVRGRVLLRSLHTKKLGATPSDDEILETFQQMKADYSANPWYLNPEPSPHFRLNACT